MAGSQSSTLARSSQTRCLADSSIPKVRRIGYHDRPINVSTAEESQVGETVKVFIELRDVNYPGSTYDLSYAPQSGSLKGMYIPGLLASAIRGGLHEDELP